MFRGGYPSILMVIFIILYRRILTERYRNSSGKIEKYDSIFHQPGSETAGLDTSAYYDSLRMAESLLKIYQRFDNVVLLSRVLQNVKLRASG